MENDRFQILGSVSLLDIPNTRSMLDLKLQTHPTHIDTQNEVRD
jgi:hypothetical protein